MRQDRSWCVAADVEHVGVRMVGWRSRPPVRMGAGARGTLGSVVNVFADNATLIMLHHVDLYGTHFHSLTILVSFTHSPSYNIYQNGSHVNKLHENTNCLPASNLICPSLNYERTRSR